MGNRVNGGITGSGGKNVDPLYNRSFGISKKKTNIDDLMNGPKWGAGDPNYVKKMIESGKKKPTAKK